MGTWDRWAHGAPTCETWQWGVTPDPVWDIGVLGDPSQSIALTADTTSCMGKRPRCRMASDPRLASLPASPFSSPPPTPFFFFFLWRNYYLQFNIFMFLWKLYGCAGWRSQNQPGKWQYLRGSGAGGRSPAPGGTGESAPAPNVGHAHVCIITYIC